MKKIAITIVYALAVLFLSCSKDEAENPSIQGKWKVTSLEYFQCTGTTANSVRECGTFAFCATWEFKSDGTSVITYDGGGTSTSTYTVYPGGSIGFCSTSCSNMSYAISGSNLTITTIDPASNDCMQRYKFVKAP